MAKPARKPDPIVAARKAKDRKPRRQAAAEPPEPIGPPPEPFDDPFPDPFRDVFPAPQARSRPPVPPAALHAVPERPEPADAAQPAPCRRLSRPITPRLSRTWKKDAHRIGRELLFMAALPGVLAAVIAAGWSLNNPPPPEYLPDGRGPVCARLTRATDQCFYVPFGNLTLEQLAAMSGLAPLTLRRLNPSYPRDPAVKIDRSILLEPRQ